MQGWSKSNDQLHKLVKEIKNDNVKRSVTNQMVVWLKLQVPIIKQKNQKKIQNSIFTPSVQKSISH